MNVNGKLADIWLIYRCIECEFTKNLAVVERRPVSRIGRALFEAATVNDIAVARRLARDAAVLERAGTRFARGDVVITDATGVAVPRIELTFEDPLLVRLDEVLSVVTGVSRSRLRKLEQTHQLVLAPRRELTRLALTGNTTVMLTDRPR